MTVEELIEELQKVPGDTNIEFQMNDGCCGDYIILELSSADAETHNFHNEPEYSTVQVRFKAIEGFTSCIQSGTTKDFIKQQKDKLKLEVK
jgi:hypothetical protein